MESISKRKTRSRTDVIKLKLDDLNNLLNNIFKQLDSHSNLDFKRIAYGYLIWTEKALKAIAKENSCIEINSLLRKISYYETTFNKSLEVRGTLLASMNNTTISDMYSIKGEYSYNHFLEQGSVFFTKVMDPYKLWFEKFDVKAMLENKEPNTLSYTLVALLARFALPRDSIAYKQIYGKALQGVKVTLPNSYCNPNRNHVVALGLLCFVGLSHSNFNLAKRYFLDAIRMAQCLGYNINDESFEEIDISDTRYNELLQGRRIWKTLCLTYLVLSSCIPDMPFIKFEVKDPLYFFRKNQNEYVDSNKPCLKAMGENSYMYVQDFIEVNIRISTHIQKTKESYQMYNDCSKIPTEDLILARSDFINCLTVLTNLIQDIKLAKNECDYSKKELSEKIDDHEFNFKRYFKVLVQHTIITLYYPSVIVYPQPVQFTAAELRLLFNNASQVVAYCLNKGLDNRLDREVFIRFHKFNAKHQFQSNIHIPFYYQACYCFFALINLLHYSSQLKRQDIFMIDESKTKCFLLVRELDEISKSNNKNQAKDANNALDQIKSHLYRFELPPDLIQKISVYLN